MTIGDVWREHLRITLLRVLEKSPAYSANESILHDSMGHLGIRATRDQVKAELTWLHEVGLVIVEEIESIIIATATSRGCEVAQGLVTHPGVKRPSPKG